MIEKDMADNPLASPRLLGMIAEGARRGSTLHEQFLQARRVSLRTMQALIALQMQGEPISTALEPQADSLPKEPSLALFDSRQLEEFGRGKISACLGPRFAHYDARRIPRIPNGDLRMMSRITAIEGQPGDFQRLGSITAQVDIPPDAWYFQESVTPQLPLSLWMETALQPCGFLSAYLDTYALVPHGEFFFRNLDGQMQFASLPDVRGKTITTQARMLSSVAGGGTVIQKFAFTLTCEGREICAGESSFGYFAVETMANQVGLDGGRRVPPAIQADAALASAVTWLDVPALQAAPVDSPHLRLPGGRLHLVGDIAVATGAGRYGGGYVYARRPVNPQDWFYPFHFHQDPVMPGSLGVEALYETMQAYALHAGLAGGLRSPRFGLLPGPQPAGSIPGGPRPGGLRWSYRGQITQQHKLMELEIHLKPIERQPGQVALRGDASLWVDGLRIYAVQDLQLGILEA